jgi:death on curing protein
VTPPPPGAAGFELPDAETLLTFHAALIERYGGALGVRDAGALDAALARPLHLLAYAEPGAAAPSVPQLAAALAFSICRIRHPFVDGNKRVALAALDVTLGLNALDLDATEAEAADAVWRVAEGVTTEEEFAAWVARHASRSPGAA